MEVLKQDEATVAFVVVCASGVFTLIQGIAFTYSGIVPYNSVLTQSAYSLIALAICTTQFFIIGSSLMCEDNHGFLKHFVGTYKDAFMLALPSSNKDSRLATYLSFRILTLLFSAVSASIMIGAATQRGRFIPSVIFLALWLTFIYDPIAYWCWNANGWSYQIGAIDYAGGTAVHCTAGVTALVYSWHLGPRIESSKLASSYSYFCVVFGTFLVWLGWIGFNTGSAMSPSLRALRALINTHISASAGGLTWMFLDHSFDGTWSLIGFCSGVLSGLVCVTPSAAQIAPWASVVFGVTAGVVCNLGTKIKFYLSIDDALDIFAVHGVGGFLGSVLTGVFAQNGNLEGIVGLIYGNPWQVVVQLASASAIVTYTAVVSHVLLRIVRHYMPLSIDPDQEVAGLDLSEHGEIADAGRDFHNQRSSSLSSGDANNNRYNQTHLNTSMFPDSETPLLKMFNRNNNRYGD